MSDDTPELDVDEDPGASRAGRVGAEGDGGRRYPKAHDLILEDSELRTLDRNAAPGSYVEHRRSEDTVPPEDTPAS